MPQLRPPSAPRLNAERHDLVPPSPHQRTFMIGALAADFGVTLRALRFYEAKGLLKPKRRGTTRFYTPADRERLVTILKGKELGFSLRDIREMLADQARTQTEAATSPTPIHVPADKLGAQIAQLEAQKAEIERALASLRAYAASAQGDPAQAPRSLAERVTLAFGGRRA